MKYFILLLFAVLIMDITAFLIGWKSYPLEPQPVVVTRGRHIGKAGNVVSIPWMGNLYNFRPQVNIASDNGRAWINVWSFQCANTPE